MIMIFEARDLIAGNNDTPMKELGTKNLQSKDYGVLSQSRTALLIKNGNMKILKECETIKMRIDGYEIEELFWYLYHKLRREHTISIPLTILHFAKELSPKEIEKLIKQLERKAFEKL